MKTGQPPGAGVQSWAELLVILDSVHRIRPRGECGARIVGGWRKMADFGGNCEERDSPQRHNPFWIADCGLRIGSKRDRATSVVGRGEPGTGSGEQEGANGEERTAGIYYRGPRTQRNGEQPMGNGEQGRANGKERVAKSRRGHQPAALSPQAGREVGASLAAVDGFG